MSPGDLEAHILWDSIPFPTFTIFSTISNICLVMPYTCKIQMQKKVTPWKQYKQSLQVLARWQFYTIWKILTWFPKKSSCKSAICKPIHHFIFQVQEEKKNSQNSLEFNSQEKSPKWLFSFVSMCWFELNFMHFLLGDC